METLWQDLRYGWRSLLRNPGFAIVAIVTLAIGIGANVTIFSVVNGVLLKPLPFPESRRLVTIWETDSERNIVRGTASPAEFLDWQEMNHSFENLAAWRGLYYTITGSGDPERVWGSEVSGNFFRMLKVAPAMGRDFRQGRRAAGARAGRDSHRRSLAAAFRRRSGRDWKNDRAGRKAGDGDWRLAKEFFALRDVATV